MGVVKKAVVAGGGGGSRRGWNCHLAKLCYGLTLAGVRLPPPTLWCAAAAFRSVGERDFTL